MTIQEQIDVMTHFANGGIVESRKKKSKDVEDYHYDRSGMFDFVRMEYRIKPQEQNSPSVGDFVKSTDRGKTIYGTLLAIDNTKPYPYKISEYVENPTIEVKTVEKSSVDDIQEGKNKKR